MGEKGQPREWIYTWYAQDGVAADPRVRHDQRIQTLPQRPLLRSEERSVRRPAAASNSPISPATKPKRPQNSKPCSPNTPMPAQPSSAKRDSAAKKAGKEADPQKRRTASTRRATRERRATNDKRQLAMHVHRKPACASTGYLDRVTDLRLVARRHALTHRMPPPPTTRTTKTSPTTCNPTAPAPPSARPPTGNSAAPTSSPAWKK